MRLKKAIIKRLADAYLSLNAGDTFIPIVDLVRAAKGNPTSCYKALEKMIKLGLGEELYLLQAYKNGDGVFRPKKRRYIRLNIELISLVFSAPPYFTIEEKVEWARNIQKFIISPIIEFTNIHDLFIEPLVNHYSIFIPPSFVEEIEKERWIHRSILRLLNETKGNSLRLKILNRLNEREREELSLILYHLMRRWPAFCRRCFNRTLPLLRPSPCPDHGEVNPITWNELISLIQKK